MTTPEGRDRIKDTQIVINHLLSGLFTWTSFGNWGVDYGYVGDGRKEQRGYTSAEEILAKLGFTPESIYFCPKCKKDLTVEDIWKAEDRYREPVHTGCWQKVTQNDNWPTEELKTYAAELWENAGDFLRAGVAPPIPSAAFRPPWADMRSKDGALELTVPDELIPFVTREISNFSGMLAAYDRGPRDRDYISMGFIRAQFEVSMALWQTRRQLALLEREGFLQGLPYRGV